MGLVPLTSPGFRDLIREFYSRQMMDLYDKKYATMLGVEYGSSPLTFGDIQYLYDSFETQYNNENKISLIDDLKDNLRTASGWRQPGMRPRDTDDRFTGRMGTAAKDVAIKQKTLDPSFTTSSRFGDHIRRVAATIDKNERAERKAVGSKNYKFRPDPFFDWAPSLYYFKVWLNETRSKLKKDLATLKAASQTNEDYIAGLKQILDNEVDQAGQSIDPDLVAQEVSDARQVLLESKFNKQQYLIQNLEDLSKLSRRRFLWDATTSDTSQPSQTLGINQDRLLRLTNSHVNAINKLSGAAVGKRMFKATTEELSKLVPVIKIYKIRYGKNREKLGDDIEIKFPTKSHVLSSAFNYDSNFATRIDSERSPEQFSTTRMDYGIQSFSWEYDGNDPFAVDRDIGATLELYFQDFAQFTALRGSDTTTAYRYVDLVAPLDADPDAKHGTHFQNDIRVVAGWQAPRSSSQSMREAVKASQVDLVLTPMDYNISFEGNGNGAVTVTINYRARIESVGKNRLINVIAATKKEAREIEKLNKDIATESVDEKKKQAYKKDLQALYKKVREQAAKRFIEKMLESASVYWRTLDIKSTLVSAIGASEAQRVYELIYDESWSSPMFEDGLQLSLDYIDDNPFPNLQPVLSDLPLVTEVDIDNPEKEGSIKNGEKIVYTFLGDIIQTAIQIACENDNFLRAPSEVLQELKIALLDFRVGTKTYNLGDLPVEMGVFTEFLQNKIGKRDIQTKSIISFINELLADVVTNRIEEDLNLRDGISRSFKIGYEGFSKDLSPAYIRQYDLEDPSDLREILHRPRIQNLVVYSDSPQKHAYKIDEGKYASKKRSDEKEGLHHFTLGSNKSLVKNISFDRVDLEYARERRLTINREDPYALLANVFNVSIDMFGNNYFRPGSYIYVDPKVMGDVGRPFIRGSIANVMGLGGYHIITSVANRISSNSFSTTIEAVWETSGDGGFSRTTAVEEIDGADKEKDGDE